MSYNYHELVNLPQDISVIQLLKFLGKIRNASLEPGVVDSASPPILYWWFYEENDEANLLIAGAVKNFPWKEEWVLETRRGKWLLYPRRIRKVEQSIKGIPNEEDVTTMDEGRGWLINNDPEFGRKTNIELREFTKYFRPIVEKYLKLQER